MKHREREKDREVPRRAPEEKGPGQAGGDAEGRDCDQQGQNQYQAAGLQQVLTWSAGRVGQDSSTECTGDRTAKVGLPGNRGEPQSR